MPLLSQLTLEQRARVTQWRDEWLRIALSTAPADRPRVEKTIAQLYARAGEPEPLVAWCDSPATGLMLMHTLRELPKREWSLDSPWMWPDRPPPAWWPPALRTSLESSLRTSLESLGWPLDRSRRTSLESIYPCDPLNESVTSLLSSLSTSVDTQLTSSVLSTLEASLLRYLQAYLTASRSAPGLSLQLSLECGFLPIIGHLVMDALYGPHHHGLADVSWIALYTFCRDVLGVEYAAEASSHLDLWSDASKSCGWWWSFSRSCIVCEYPDRVELDQDVDPPRLHSETGAALRFRDGWSLYCVQGMQVDPDIVEDRNSITVQRIDEERNSELRRIMVDLYGRGRFLRDAGAEVVHRDRFGTLWRRSIRGRPMLMVEVTNSTPEPDGSFRVFFLSVHPELRPILAGGALGEPQEPTARNAVASTFGLRGEEYWPASET